MNINIIVLIFKIVVLIAALVASWFAVMLLFFYEKFQVFNELVNGQYLVGRDKYGSGSGFKLDNWVMGWHTVIAVFCLLVAAWLFWTFYTYMQL
ncbi:MAG: hypothetical protein ABIH22_03375 [Candidatus Margulisiibacteriota bacterium]